MNRGDKNLNEMAKIFESVALYIYSGLKKKDS